MSTGGIRNKVLFLALFPATGIAVLLAFYFVTVQIRDLQQALEEHGLAIARHLAPAGEYGVFSGNREILDHLASAAHREADVRSVTITDADGVALVRTGPPPLPHRPLGRQAVLSITPSDNGRSLIFRAPILQSQTEISDYLEVEMTGGEVKPKARSRTVMGWVAVELSRQSTQKKQADTIIKSFLIVLAGLVVSCLIALRMGKAVSDPILRLTDTVEELERGNLATRVHAGATGELQTLENGINSMAATLQTARDNLRDRVNQATMELRETLAQLEKKNHELEIERKKAQEANQSKSRFLANMSHELRTPLNAIIGYSEMMEEDAVHAGDKEYVPDIQKVNAAGKHLLALINDILDLSKVEAGKMNLYLETAEITSVIQYAVATIRPLAEQNNNKLEVDCPQDIGSMRMDVTKVRQVLFNLLSNACKFTEGGTVSLSAYREEMGGKEWVNFRVADTGIGMDLVQMERLFEAFSQADASIARQYGGTGLGLALCKRISELMGGEILVKSSADEGSTFTVRLPAELAPGAAEWVVQVDQSSAQPASDSEPEGVRFRSGDQQDNERRKKISTVLIIDDDIIMHDMVKRMLSKEGFFVETATSGEEGLRRAAELRPHAILLDVLMPGMDGWTVLEKLKSDPELSKIPVIMLSMFDDRSRGYALGVTEYITKPADRDQLLAILWRCVREGPDAPILIVDEDESHRQLLRGILENEGWEVTAAHNGRAAMESVTARRPGVILLDLQMPDMDGFKFISDLRKQPELRDIPVAVMTAMDLTREDKARLKGLVQQIINKDAIAGDEILSLVKGLVKSKA